MYSPSLCTISVLRFRPFVILRHLWNLKKPFMIQIVFNIQLHTNVISYFVPSWGEVPVIIWSQMSLSVSLCDKSMYHFSNSRWCQIFGEPASQTAPAQFPSGVQGQTGSCLKHLPTDWKKGPLYSIAPPRSVSCWQSLCGHERQPWNSDFFLLPSRRHVLYVGRGGQISVEADWQAHMLTGAHLVLSDLYSIPSPALLESPVCEVSIDGSSALPTVSQS